MQNGMAAMQYISQFFGNLSFKGEY